ncbi:Rieske 2Fe-2S domain-containing protein (plasmid) [Cupriavidus basilensis]
MACPYHGWQYDNEGFASLSPLARKRPFLPAPS